ncbi:MAG: hypothetical protein OZ948_10060 [Deltaproteobacteria bacterium]|nr:hypothetical protein [Deltaproteobacteria bacterium]
MRPALLLACLFTFGLVGLVPLAPPAAADPLPPGAHQPHRDCRRLTRQIAHYADVADMARDRDDDLWEEHTLEHISRLSDRRARLCPQYADKPAGEDLRKMLALLRDAAKIAAKLYTWGLL